MNKYIQDKAEEMTRAWGLDQDGKDFLQHRLEDIYKQGYLDGGKDAKDGFEGLTKDLKESIYQKGREDGVREFALELDDRFGKFNEGYNEANRAWRSTIEQCLPRDKYSLSSERVDFEDLVKGPGEIYPVQGDEDA